LPLSEKTLIRHIRTLAGTAQNIVGIGDDCACISIPPRHQALITTDFSLEDVHFCKALHPATSVGHRCLLRGLSDIAAMGGVPIAVFLSLALPAKLPQSWVDDLFSGLLKLAEEFRVTLAGGDTARSPNKIFADIVVLGSVPQGKAILRSGAKPGDRIFVTGALGGAANTLRMLQDGRGNILAADRNSYFYPPPRLEVGRILREQKLASAMIDISDGLSTDLAHICEESGFGAEIYAEAIPRAFYRSLRKHIDLNFALHGGEDYELLFTAPSKADIPAEISRVPITEIGKIIRGRRMVLKTKNKMRTLAPAGWEHFAKP
jgi:thiamine-monophosphate kinase